MSPLHHHFELSGIHENQTKKDTAVLNKDDPTTRSLASRTKAEILWFGEGEIYLNENKIIREQGGGKNSISAV